MIIFPPAKINLGLNILAKRKDGFHELETCMILIPFYDILEINPSTSFSFIQSGLTIPGNNQDNLCIKAYQLMKEVYNINPVCIHLRKQIPMGAGLGGGSSDATYVLKGLNDLFELNIPDEELQIMAAQLGSDCPFFVYNRPQLARGRGEVLTDIDVDLTGYWLKLIYPSIHVGTKEAFSGVDISNQPSSIQGLLTRPVSTWKTKLVNDFEQSVFKIHPVLKDIKTNLYNEGALYASMSGSGSVVFGLFDKKPKESFCLNKSYTQKIIQFI
jgi:4-diphosphocytidyl-2-C-methyl-D-erythritol kinase